MWKKENERVIRAGNIIIIGQRGRGEVLRRGGTS
jgi:hypothetical protein